ncbi:hypothetical protein M407DRAFT_129249 [Tulasnella calospora MUT 4182]|uniref:Uncharacterized protein n=1 Tax=Tulasnella calospora MUT 4182 TaxID=1051891 RepID=A0A0C3QI67_9AGAM|nr:hypothetical protein M407DRAFT_129249 [Tulasnella calospora MUT 4182]
MGLQHLQRSTNFDFRRHPSPLIFKTCINIASLPRHYLWAWNEKLHPRPTSLYDPHSPTSSPQAFCVNRRYPDKICRRNTLCTMRSISNIPVLKYAVGRSRMSSIWMLFSVMPR